MTAAPIIWQEVQCGRLRSQHQCSGRRYTAIVRQIKYDGKANYTAVVWLAGRDEVRLQAMTLRDAQQQCEAYIENPGRAPKAAPSLRTSSNHIGVRYEN